MHCCHNRTCTPQAELPALSAPRHVQKAFTRQHCRVGLSAGYFAEPYLEVHVVGPLQPEKAWLGCLEDLLRLVLPELAVLVAAPHVAEGVQRLLSILGAAELFVLADCAPTSRLSFFLLLL